MSQDNISTKHRNEDGEQVTTKIVTIDGTEYPFEARGIDHEGITEYEYAGDAVVTSEAKQVLVEALGTGETLTTGEGGSQ